MWEKLQGGKHNRNNLTAWLFWDREGPKSNLEQQSNELRFSYNCNYPNCFRRKLVSFSFGWRQRKKNAVEKTWAGEQLGKESSKKVQIFSSFFCLWGIFFIFIMLDKLTHINLCVILYILDWHAKSVSALCWNRGRQALTIIIMCTTTYQTEPTLSRLVVCTTRSSQAVIWLSQGPG